MVVDVDGKNYEEYLGLATGFYKGTEFPMMQIIWPTKSHQFPNDQNAPEGFKKWQPVLGKIKF